MKSDNQQIADRLLDASLERFADVEPRAGLEGRILAGVAARNRAVRRRHWAVGFAVSALAMIAVIVSVRSSRREIAPAPIPLRASSSAKTLGPLAPAVGGRHGTPPPDMRVRQTRGRDRRPQQFPTPAPLSEQEKLLLIYVQEAPKSALAAPSRDAASDLEIPDLKVAALEIRDLPRANNE